MGREQAPDPRAVCVEQDEYLGAQVEEVDKGQRLPEVDLFQKGSKSSRTHPTVFFRC